MSGGSQFGRMPVNVAPSSTPAATKFLVEFVAVFVASHWEDLGRARAAVVLTTVTDHGQYGRAGHDVKTCC